MDLGPDGPWPRWTLAPMDVGPGGTRGRMDLRPRWTWAPEGRGAAMDAGPRSTWAPEGRGARWPPPGRLRGGEPLCYPRGATVSSVLSDYDFALPEAQIAQ